MSYIGGYLLRLYVFYAGEKFQRPLVLTCGDAQEHTAVDLLGELLRGCGNDVAEYALLGGEPADEGDSRRAAVPEYETHTALGEGVGHQLVHAAGEHEPASGGGGGSRKDRCDKPLLGDASLVQDRNVSADLLDDAHLVRDDDDRDAELCVYVTDKLKYLTCGFGVERTCRLVAEQHLRLRRQRTGDRNTLLLTAGELRRVGVCLVGKPDEREKLPCPLFRFGTGNASNYDLGN